MYTLYDYIYKTFLKLKNYRNGDQISGCQGLKRGWEWEGSRCGYKRAT